MHCLRYFTAVYPFEFDLMRRNETGTFFLAITSINITHVLMTYFYLNKNGVSDQSKKVRAKRKQFKRFAKLNALSKRTFYELHAFMLTYFYHLWVQECKKT